jgi:hypothetical protein
MQHTLAVEKDGTILVSIPFEDGSGTIYFSFANVEQFNSRELSTVLQVDVMALGKPFRMTNRINLLSSNAKDDYIRSLKRLTRNDDLPIEQAFVQAIELLKEHLESLDDSHWAEEVRAESMGMLFRPFLVEGAPSILFGKGGGAKTYLALRMAMSLATGKPFLGFMPSKKCKTLFIDYEDTAQTFSARRGHLFEAEPSLTSVENDRTIRYVRPMGTPLPDLVHRLKKVIKEHDIGFIIVDSAVSACGGEPEKADVVARYFNALSGLGVTSLTIAHETKSENHAYPFGSVYWYNFPRSIWNVRSVREDDDEITQNSTNVVETGLFHRKANNGPINEMIPLRVTFHNKGEQLEKVVIARGDDGVWEDEKSISSRIKKLLKDGGKTRSELVDALPDVASKMLEKELSRLKTKGTISLMGTKGSPYILAKNHPPKPLSPNDLF